MVIIKTLNTQEENSTMDRLPQDWSTLLLSIINIIFFIYDWAVGMNVQRLRDVKLWPNVHRFTALGMTDSVSDSVTTGLIILLNNAIYTKFLFLIKSTFQLPYKIKKTCSGISRPLVLLIQRTNSLFSVLYFNGAGGCLSFLQLLYNSGPEQ